jgi:GT2 family glycosyltransferase
LNEDLFLYYEDADWCARVRSAGYRCMYLAQVLASHDGSATAGIAGSFDLTETSAYYLARNPILLAFSRPPLQRVLSLSCLIGIYGPRNMLRLEAGHRVRTARAYLRGVYDGICGRHGARFQVRCS